MNKLRYLLGIAAVVALLVGSLGVGLVSATNDSEWTVPMTADAGPEGINAELAFGIHPDATDGYDSGIDIPAPPPPPVTSAFDAHFTIVHHVFSRLNHDFRGDTPNEWTLEVQSTNEPIDLSWDAAGVPAHLSAIMKYETQKIDMKTQASVELPAGTYVITITVSDFSVSDCEAYPTPTKVGYSTAFSVGVSGGVEPYNYDWDFGDGNGSEAAAPTHTYAAADTYTVTVRVWDDYGVEETCSFELVVHPPLSVSDCGAAPNPTKVDYPVDFSVTVSGGIGDYTYEWDFGDGSEISTDESPTHTYTIASTYTVTVTVWDELDNMQTCSFDVVVNEALAVSDCQADPNPTKVDYDTDFSVTFTGGVEPYSFQWDFGDGSPLSSEESPTYAYDEAGTYQVEVTVFDSLGNEGTCSFEITVEPALAVIDCEADPNPTKVGYDTDFSVTFTGGVEPYNFQWDFGDGSPLSSEESPKYAYDEAGTYQVEVTVFDSLGNEGTCSFEITVEPALAVIDCEADPNPTKVGYDTDFSVTVSGGFGGYTYLWEFGDDETSTDATPTHSYDEPGTYTVKVTVQDERGNTRECEFELVVNPPLSVSDCQADPDPTWVGHETTFSVSVSGGVGPYTYEWNFGDGSEVNTEESPTHTYTTPDTYTVTVTVTDSLDNEADCSFALEVQEAMIEITLKAGWNLVSVPIVPDDPSVGTVFAGVDVVYVWDPVTGTYSVPTEVEVTRGYWVAVVDDTVITVSGTPVYTWTAEMISGWDLIGSLFCVVDFTAPDTDPAGNVEGFSYRWDPETGTHVLSTTIEPGMGHWVAVTGDCQLTLSCIGMLAEEG